MQLDDELSPLDESQAQGSEPVAPAIDWAFARDLARDLEAEEYDEDVQEFLSELLASKPSASEAQLQQAATLLLQDEVDFSPELRSMGIEPDEELIELFIACGAEVNARNSFGELPLVLAARYGYTDIVDMLLDAGANKNAHNAHGQQAADLAATPELIEKLMPTELRSGSESSDTTDATDFLADQTGEEAPLPPFVEDADWGESDEDFFAPKHDCGLGQ